jgi:hypothetical protein
MVLQWPGKWSENIIGLRLTKIKQLNKVTRIMKGKSKIHASLVLFSSIMSVCTICHTDCPWHLNSFRTRSVIVLPE